MKRHGIVAGVSAAFRGLRIATNTREVGRAYLKLAAVVLALSIVLDIAGIWTVLHFTAGDGDGEWWARIGLILLRVAGIGIVLLAAPVIAMFISNTLFPFLSERVFLAGMRAVDPARADQLAAMPGLPLATAISQNLIRMMLFIALSVAAFAFSFVPVVGSGSSCPTPVMTSWSCGPSAARMMRSRACTPRWRPSSRPRSRHGTAPRSTPT